MPRGGIPLPQSFVRNHGNRQVTTNAVPLHMNFNSIQAQLFIDEPSARLVLSGVTKALRRAIVAGLQRFETTETDLGYEIFGFWHAQSIIGFKIPWEAVVAGSGSGSIRSISVWSEIRPGIHHKLCERPTSFATPSESPEEMDLLLIENDGPRIGSTNYWEGAYAAEGKFVVSCNAGHVRLLVPPTLVPSILDGLRGTKKLKAEALPGELWRTRRLCTEWLFEDYTDTPFFIQLSPGSFVDFRPRDSADLSASIWTKGAAGMPQAIAILPLEWRVTPQLRLRPLPRV
jgi:hypothetical protein